MGLLSRLFPPGASEKASADLTRPKRENPLRALGYQLVSFASGGARPVSYKSAIKADEAMRNPISYRCIDKIGLAVQSVSWYVEDENNPAPLNSMSRNQDAKVQALEKVLNDPNPSMTGAQLRYWMAITYAVYGRVLLKIGVLNGRINAIYPLDPAAVEIKTDIYGNITQFIYGTASEKTTMPSFQTVRRDSQGRPLSSFAVQIVKPNLSPLTDILGGNTALNSIGIPSDIVNLLLQRAHDTADNNPNVRHVIVTDPMMTIDEEDRLRDNLDNSKVGESDSGDIMVLRGSNAQLMTLDDGLSDLHKKVPLDDMGRMIAGAFGVPVALLGFAGVDGSKFANNYIESRLSFFEDTIIPGYVVPLEDALTSFLTEDGYRVKFDRDTIPALQERRIETAVELSKVTFLSDDEKRELAGFMPRGRINDD